MFGRLGLTGKTVPPNGLLMRFQRIVRPTDPSFSVAPMTATDCGLKIASSGRLPTPSTSRARSGPVGDVTPLLVVSTIVRSIGNVMSNRRRGVWRRRDRLAPGFVPDQSQQVNSTIPRTNRAGRPSGTVDCPKTRGSNGLHGPR